MAKKSMRRQRAVCKKLGHNWKQIGGGSTQCTRCYITLDAERQTSCPITEKEK